MITIKSLGCTHYELASQKNFKDNNKKVMIRIHIEDSYAYIACSEQLSQDLRACNNSEELNNKMSMIKNLIIGKELEVV